MNLSPDKKRPYFGVYNGYVGNLTSHIEQGAISAMSIWKPNPTIDEKPVPYDYDEAFNKRYLIVSPNNVQKLRRNIPGYFQGTG